MKRSLIAMAVLAVCGPRPRPLSPLESAGAEATRRLLQAIAARRVRAELPLEAA